MSAASTSSKAGAKHPPLQTPASPISRTSTPTIPPLTKPATTLPPNPHPISHQLSQSPAHSTYDDEKRADHIVVEVQDVDPHYEPVTSMNALNLFHTALGIPPPKPPKPSKKKNAPPPPKHQPNLTEANKGVYHQVLTNERWTRYKYHFCSVLITLCMFLQIIVGASVTAFGAGSASHVLITVFGAANTALASLLAVLKSQGLPNRIRQDWNGWKELREFIEEQEREIEMVVSRRVEKEVGDLKVWERVKGIEARYNAVRLTSEANRPDTYIRVPVVGTVKV